MRALVGLLIASRPAAEAALPGNCRGKCRVDAKNRLHWVNARRFRVVSVISGLVTAQPSSLDPRPPVRGF
jgi:hypothetical protein